MEAYTSGILFDTNSVAIDIKYDDENAVKFPDEAEFIMGMDSHF